MCTVVNHPGFWKKLVGFQSCWSGANWSSTRGPVVFHDAIVCSLGTPIGAPGSPNCCSKLLMPTAMGQSQRKAIQLLSLCMLVSHNVPAGIPTTRGCERTESNFAENGCGKLTRPYSLSGWQVPKRPFVRRVRKAAPSPPFSKSIESICCFLCPVY